MKLIKLFSNKDSFHSIEFNREGLSLILGKQKDPNKKNETKTYNGVGKSLVIFLINFCLGSDKNTELERKLQGWSFSLEFENLGKDYLVTRNVDNQNSVTFNGKQMKLKEYRDYLGKEVFLLEEPKPFLGFRPLICRFIRPQKQSYIKYDQIYKETKPFENLISIGYLLGLDYDLINDKRDIYVKLDEVSKLQKTIRNDPVFKEFFTKDFSVEIEKKDLEESIEKLENDLQKFKVAENYHNIEKNADEVKRELDNLRNNLILTNNSIESINFSLKERDDISPEKVETLYNEININLPNLVKKKLNDVSNFHKLLIENRRKRLFAEKRELEKKRKLLEEQIFEKSNNFDYLLEYLSTYRALDEFVELNNYISSLKIRLQKYYEYDKLIDELNHRKQVLNISFAEQNKYAEDYLTENEEHTEQIITTFRNFSRKFYDNKPGGITIKNNTNKNQIRFDLKVDIQDDTSDGINQVKIFCFDMLLLALKENHFVEFLLHDSRLYSGMDPRQRAVLFQTAFQFCKENNTQYIATVNQDEIDSIKDILSSDDFIKIFNEKSVVLELTDEDDSEKLLGFQVDLKYED